MWFVRSYKGHNPTIVLLVNALETMGAGLPSAMAAHLVHTDRPFISICGNGGFMMNIQELETAVPLGIHITVVLQYQHYSVQSASRLGRPEFAHRPIAQAPEWTMVG
ncbi:hypothetical protein B2J77_20340 [Pseudomonas parafulva]|uniref:Thiamine pyrophosphate enzyme TPP-binding domain-containing protein n=1 Tax=Pseudomonas parafulva TaxID=157782 RepID=A0ABN4Y569_9PSED|nr:hypothetical protein B2J77_20340 [Pseudomonas parafulva]